MSAIPTEIAVHEVEEVERFLDDIGVPRSVGDGGSLSLKGRVRWLVERSSWRQVAPTMETAQDALAACEGVFVPSMNKRDRYRLAAAVLGEAHL